MTNHLYNKDNLRIPVYIINLPERTDRLKSILDEFRDKDEFDINIIPAVSSPRGAEGLWKSIISIIEKVNNTDDDVIIICEDDHVFTNNYNRDAFLTEIVKSATQGCQLLFGGIGNFKNAVPLSPCRLWIDWCWCTQFMVVFRPAFSVILNAKFGENDVADEFLSFLFSNKMVLYPFVSRQKSFGYSDVTITNNELGHIEDLFNKTESRLNKIMRIYNQYCCSQ